MASKALEKKKAKEAEARLAAEAANTEVVEEVVVAETHVNPPLHLLNKQTRVASAERQNPTVVEED